MLFKIAWRNVWRNRLRSTVIIIAIGLGIWAGLFVMGISVGMTEQRRDNIISSKLSHIQIHDPEYVEDQKVGHLIDHSNRVIQTLEEHPEVKNWSARIKLTGMASSPVGAFGVQITGVDPEKEKQVTDIYKQIEEGNYFEEDRKNAIVIGRKLAEKLNIDLGSKMVLNFQDMEGNITAGAFRIVGVYKTDNTQMDEVAVFLKNEDLKDLLGMEEENYHEMALLADNFENINQVKENLAQTHSNLSVRTWKELAPTLAYADDMMATSLYIFIGIILCAMAFGIVNTMLMAVLERKRELGMLMSIGMNKLRLFSMIVLETVFLSLVGGPFGILLGYFSIDYFQRVGIDLSVFGEGLESLGIGAMIYPDLDNIFYFNIGMMVVIAAILSSIYPAIKALKYKPAETIRGI